MSSSTSTSLSSLSYQNLTWEQFEEYHNPLRNFNRPERVSSTASSSHSSAPSQSPTDFEVPQFTYEQNLSNGGGKDRSYKIPSAELVQQRRTAANERERRRVNTMNAAYDELRQVLPTADSEKKLSKFETLQMAQQYIEHLQQLLKTDAPSEFDVNFQYN